MAETIEPEKAAESRQAEHVRAIGELRDANEKLFEQEHKLFSTIPVPVCETFDAMTIAYFNDVVKSDSRDHEHTDRGQCDDGQDQEKCEIIGKELIDEHGA